MNIISNNLLKDVIKNLCVSAAEKLSPYPYRVLKNELDKNSTEKLVHILQNAEKAAIINRPLCQDTGTVHVFLSVGHQLSFESNPEKIINEAVGECYIENYFRKSIIENNFISGENTRNNLPAITEISYISGNESTIGVLLKGAGCDNVGEVKMMLPSTSKSEFVDFVVNTILEKGKNACPPLFVSVACGTSSDRVMTEAQKAYFSDNNEYKDLADEIKNRVNRQASEKYNGFYLADIRITMKPHHMASFPVAVSFNCHSLRIACASIRDGKIVYSPEIQSFEKFSEKLTTAIDINTSDISALKNLKENENILLSGEILVARDAAHKKMLDIINNNKQLPFDIKDKLIFYAAPCPARPGEIIGPIGPTTASRMDKYIPLFPQIAGTIGKGERSSKTADFIRKNNSLYLEVEGGIASLLASSFESYEIIAFPELAGEAVAVCKINKLPAKVAIAKIK